jgi:hypothetical protein
LTRRHHVFRRLFYLLLTTMLSATFGAMRTAAADFGYPPPPGPYRSESQMPRTGLLPLPTDTFSASDTADILFGSVPTLPPSTADPDDPGQQALKGSIPSPPVHAQTTVPGAPPDDRDGWPMDFGHEMQSPAYPGPGIPAGRHYPPHAPAYPGYQQPAPPYYPGYPRQYENQSTGYPPSGGYAAPHPTSEAYAMPATSDPVPDAARYAPDDAMEGYPAAIEMRDLPDGPPTGAPEAAARDIFRPAE